MTVDILAALTADTAGHTSTTEAVLFWVLGAVAVVAAIGVVAAPKAVYSAMFLAATMIVLAVFYIAQGALFLGVVHARDDESRRRSTEKPIERSLQERIAQHRELIERIHE